MRAIRLCNLGLAILLLAGPGAPGTVSGKAAVARAPARSAPRLAAQGAFVAPLDSSPGLSSGFGEFRDAHFHAGLDYSTEQVEGRPVRAVLDGWVERVRASGIGYGRAIYLRLSDGHTAVYGHLSRFAPPLDNWVAARQETAGVYEQDLNPAPHEIAFKQGDVIAWSGQSGAGPPHLHFELRQGDMNLNPLEHGFALPDRTPPTLAAAALSPVGPRSRVGAGVEPARIALKAGQVVTAPPVRGPFDLEVDTFDRGDGRANRLATYRLEARLDGRAAFLAEIDSVSWDDATEVECVYDYARTLAGDDTWRTLRLLPTYRAGVIRRGPSVWSLTPGMHRFEFIATDEAGNRARAVLDVPVLPADSAPAPAPETAGDTAGVTRCAGVAGPCTVEARADGLALDLALPAGSRFAPALLATRTLPPDTVAPGLVALGAGIDVAPAELVLRAAAQVTGRGPLAMPGEPAPRGLFLRQQRAWSFVTALDSAGAFKGSSRRIGAFAVFADTTRPTIVPAAAYHWPAPKGDAPLPAVAAAIRDHGAVLSAREQSIYVDDRRVPAEYDPEAGRLTWRPRARLTPGRHVVRIEAVDRLGNRAVATVPLEVE